VYVDDGYIALRSAAVKYYTFYGAADANIVCAARRGPPCDNIGRDDRRRVRYNKYRNATWNDDVAAGWRGCGNKVTAASHTQTHTQSIIGRRTFIYIFFL
jgi:hypothetical protein